VMVEPEQMMNLSSAPAGARLRVLKVAGGWSMRRRLAALGVVECEDVVKVGGADSGPVDVEVAGRRSAIGRGMAERIAVVPAGEIRK